MVAAATTETTSKAIQSFTVLPVPRGVSPARLPSHSWEEAIEADSLCQNSEVAICVSQTSNVHKTMGFGRDLHPAEDSKKHFWNTLDKSLTRLRTFELDAPYQSSAVQRIANSPYGLSFAKRQI
jgi:hypothetical protein